MAKSKKELYALITEGVKNALVSNGFEDAVSYATSVIDTYLKPGVFGAKIDLESVVRRDAEGNIVEMQCSVSKQWLEASVANFYEDKTGKGPIGIDGVALRRLSRSAEAIRKKHLAAITKEKNRINQELYSGNISVEEAKQLIAELETQKPEF